MKKHLNKFYTFIILSTLLPQLGSAQIGGGCSNNFSTVGDVLHWGTCILSSAVVPLLFAVALVVFIWGIVKYMANPDNEEERKKGANFMWWGVLALFVMVSVWGLVNVLNVTFGVRNVIPQLPEVR